MGEVDAVPGIFTASQDAREGEVSPPAGNGQITFSALKKLVYGLKSPPQPTVEYGPAPEDAPTRYCKEQPMDEEAMRAVLTVTRPLTSGERWTFDPDEDCTQQVPLAEIRRLVELTGLDETAADQLALAGLSDEQAVAVADLLQRSPLALEQAIGAVRAAAPGPTAEEVALAPTRKAPYLQKLLASFGGLKGKRKRG